MIKLRELMKSITPEKVIEIMGKLGITDYIERDKYIIFPTVCHNADQTTASRKLYYYKNNNFFYCYTSCEGMSIDKFLEHFYDCRGYDYNWYNDIYLFLGGDTIIESDFDIKEKQTNYRTRYSHSLLPSLSTYPKGILDMFSKYYPIEWLNDGISKESMDKFNILYSSTQNKIIIPHYDTNGELVGIRGRALNEQEVNTFGKYMPVKIENTFYTHPLSLNLYGLNITKENIISLGYAFIFEAEKSVLQLESFKNTINCGVAICGSSLNKYQLQILLRECHPKEIILCLDKEEKDESEDYFNKLAKICQKYKNYCNFSFIYDRDNLLEMKDSPTDKGEEIFNQLLLKRSRINGL